MIDADTFKRSCATAYASGLPGSLLGPSLHPGGLRLTDRLADLALITGRDCVIDVASGRGTSAIHLARTRSCRVVGIEYGAAQVAEATQAARDARVARVTFLQGDAERLPLADGSADVILCECSLCLFPDKATALKEMWRVLRPGGRVALADVLVEPEGLPEAWRGWLARVACLADARPLAMYRHMLASGFGSIQVESHPEALHELVTMLESRMGLVAAVFGRADPSPVRSRLWEEIHDRITGGQIGYALLVAGRVGTPVTTEVAGS